MAHPPAFHNALALHQAGRLAEAEAAYRQIVSTHPDHADTWSLLGVVVAVRGDVDEAMLCADKAVALDPQSALPFFHRGNILMGLGRLEAAVDDYRQALRHQSTLTEVHYNLGNVLRALGKWEEARQAYADALSCQSGYVPALNNLVLCMVHEKVFDQAFILAKDMTDRFPDYGDGWITLANVADKQKDYALALTASEIAVRLCPNSPYAWFGYGVALNRSDRYVEAVAANLQGLRLKPDYTDLWDNLGQTLQSTGNLEEAEKAFRTCLDISGQAMSDERVLTAHADAFGNRHWHLALLELLQGKYRIGFARYRSRFMEMGDLRRPNYHAPQWQGEPLSGKTILVTDEQGFGDTLMLSRFLPLLKQRGASVIFSVHPALRSFFAGWHGFDRLVVHGDAVTGHDYVVSVFDLPHWLGVTLENLSAQPYLPKPESKNTLPHHGRRRVGLVWGGSPLHVNDARRSVPLRDLIPLLRLGGMDFYSFNRDLRSGDLALMQEYGVQDLAPRIQDFAQSAALLCEMDLVISCDTSTVHLVGGMGIPVWVMLPFMPDWRWLLGRHDSPWYSSVYLFRQEKQGDWAGVVTQLVNRLSGHRPS